jgi:hypothetical protein
MPANHSFHKNHKTRHMKVAAVKVGWKSSLCGGAIDVSFSCGSGLCGVSVEIPFMISMLVWCLSFATASSSPWSSGQQSQVVSLSNYNIVIALLFHIIISSLVASLLCLRAVGHLVIVKVRIVMSLSWQLIITMLSSTTVWQRRMVSHRQLHLTSEWCDL